MISYSAKKTLLYQEIDDDRRKSYFDFTQKKFLHNIDTLYYVVKLKNDWKYDPNALLFKEYMNKFQAQALVTPDMLPVFTSEQLDNIKVPTSEWLMNGVAASKIYRYDLQQPDKFAVFVAPNTPNPETPELIVQLRSQFLWLKGEKRAVLESLSAVENLLSCFFLEIKEVKENRIDFAYHTNYIQNPTKYFKHENINKMQQSRFTRGSIEFSFRNQWDVETDYLTLGRKKSNNLFFRIYDKTKEVIQQGYKQFFIKVWYMEKLISYFDMYCIEKAFLNPSADNYKYLDVARLEFYLEHGIDEKYKKVITDLITAQSKDYETIVGLADKLTPPVTKILNIELETKRKFYATMDNSMDLLSVSTKWAPDYSHKLFRILDNKKLFHDYITRNTDDGSGVIRFIDYKAKNRLGQPWKHKRDFPTSDFWSRLQSVSLNWVSDDIKLVREYQQNLSVSLLKKQILNRLSTYGLYLNKDTESSAFSDVLDYISTLNETDLEHANQYKNKKMLLIQDRLKNSEMSLAKENNFGIIDLGSGEMITSIDDADNAVSQDYSIKCNAENNKSFVINSQDDIFESVVYDLKVKKDEYEKLLSGDLHYNQRIVIQSKLDKINDKLKEML
ncbi:hypothetical protein P4604_16555 [Lysinibacillus capsici]|uniref:hypothetical protein n=1 Tax=Lysinibacillus capsici TaxID=2115968 RepID=UPI002E234117|nr:hypothetical protein [Lysinibacillus capsici]